MIDLWFSVVIVRIRVISSSGKLDVMNGFTIVASRVSFTNPSDYSSNRVFICSAFTEGALFNATIDGKENLRSRW
jgi:hypothetical protein